MLTFFSFLLMWLGSFNWFFIAAFQYDFIAGFFGTQSSLFSRFVYFLIGMAGFVMLIMAIKNRGKLKITENPFKKVESTKTAETKLATPADAVLPNETEEESLLNEEIVANSSSYQTAPKEVVSKTGFKDFDASQYDD